MTIEYLIPVGKDANFLDLTTLCKQKGILLKTPLSLSSLNTTAGLFDLECEDSESIGLGQEMSSIKSSPNSTAHDISGFDNCAQTLTNFVEHSKFIDHKFHGPTDFVQEFKAQNQVQEGFSEELIDQLIKTRKLDHLHR